MQLRVLQKEGETWPETVERYARPYGLEHEALSMYHDFVANGRPEATAALDALYEWDLLDLVI